ncbi:MAG: LysR family transcriptional regulator [Thermoanaerobaculia bacterium]|nr:LysR family transcriptional regulator [Thermoanaerobaculia bacterium]
MNDLPLAALRALAAVHSEGGLRAAARHFGVAHSSVSRHLRELEKWLGVPLRSEPSGRQRLVLTDDGERLARAVAAGLLEIESAVASVREPKTSQSVLLGTRPSFASRWLLPRLPYLEQSHPHLEISVIVEKRLEDLEVGGLDMAVTMGARPIPGRSELLADDSLYPVMSPAYWRRLGRPSKPVDLVGARLLHDRDPQASWEIWKKEQGPPTLDTAVGPRFTSTDLVLKAAAQGQGVALARHRMATDDLQSGLLLRPLGDLVVAVEKSYWIVLPRNRLPRPAIQTVIAWLHRQVKGQSASVGPLAESNRGL